MGFSEHMTALAGEPSILYAKEEGRLRHFETRYKPARGRVLDPPEERETRHRLQIDDFARANHRADLLQRE